MYFEANRQTDGPKKLYNGCSLVSGIFSNKNQQFVLNSRREIYYGRADKVNYRVASLLKAK